MRDLENVDFGISSGERGVQRRPWLTAIFLAILALLLFAAPVSAGGGNNGATQIAGSGVYDAGNCQHYNVDPGNPLGGADPHFAIDLNEGDMTGCMYVIIDEFTCTPNGIYRERGREIYVIDGGNLGLSGTFQTTYFAMIHFTACDPELGPLGLEIFGFCQHPLVAGEETAGDFVGVTGRLHFKDDVTNPLDPIFNYTGHLKGLP